MVECNDPNCPIHGSLSTYGLEVEGKVVSNKAKKMVVVERNLLTYVPKYERYARTKSKLHAHLPACIDAKIGDVVRIKQCRRLSKTKNWVVISIKGGNE